MDISAVVPMTDAAERKFVRLRAACPHPYPRIARAANILVADLGCTSRLRVKVQEHHRIEKRRDLLGEVGGCYGG
jgi:hypothetical protein